MTPGQLPKLSRVTRPLDYLPAEIKAALDAFDADVASGVEAERDAAPHPGPALSGFLRDHVAGAYQS
jgi:hypothetical protein